MNLFQNVVVGLDGSASSRHALAWASKQQPSSIQAVNAVSPATELWFGALQVDSGLVLDTRRENMDESCKEVQIASGSHVDTHLTEEEPASALLEYSHNNGACPIVVGHEGHSSWHNHHVGRATTELLRNSDVPVVVVPADSLLEPLSGTIALCSHGAADIDHPDVAWAVELAVTNKLDLHLIDVVEPIPVGVGAFYGYGSVMISTDNDLRDSRFILLNDLRGQIEHNHPTLTVRSTAEAGHPAIQLARVINDVAPALVVIGNHHHSKLLSLLTSAITTHLPTSIHCPMAAIPVPA